MSVTVPYSDPLLHCLDWLCRFHQRPTPIEVLVAGLPLPRGQLDPENLPRAAARAALVAEGREIELSRIPGYALPALLLLEPPGEAESASACCLLGTDLKTGHRRIMDPTLGRGETQISETELAARYTGRAFFIKPDPLAGDSSTAPFARGRHWYRQNVLKHWPVYLEVLLASLLINLFGLAVPLFVMNVYDRVVPNQALETLWVLASGVGLVLIFDFLMRNLRGLFLEHAGRSTDLTLGERLFHQVLNLPLARVPARAGVLLNHFQEFDGFREFSTSVTLATLIDLPFVLLFLLVIWQLGGDLVWIPLLAIPLLLLFGLALQPALRKATAEHLRAGSEKQVLLVETLRALPLLKSLHAQEQLLARWRQLNVAQARGGLRSRAWSALAGHFALLIQQLTYVAVIVKGVYLIQAGLLSMGGLIACAILTGRALAPLAQVAALLTRAHQSGAAYQGMDELMRQPLEQGETPPALYHPPLLGELALDRVHFTYPQQPLPALRDISLHLRPGERVALIGRSGCGKTSLARLILTLYQPDSGHVLFDGVDSRQFEPGQLRNQIGYAAQEARLFHGTLKDNLTLGAGHVEDEALLRAARLTGLEDMVRQHPLGFGLMVGEGGEALSGGQRQLVALTRALLLEPPLLVLDEPTAALDHGGEAQLKARLREFLPGRTLVLMTHRASLLDLVERILVLDHGRIVADGPREQILDDLAKGRVRGG